MRAVVTGGGGFLGQALVRQLLEQGHAVRSVSRSRYPELEALGVECVQGDLSERETARRAFDEADVVFHVAARAGVWGPRAAYESSNVAATANVIATCRDMGVEKLVYTSSPSVCFDGEDHVRAGSDLPRATEFLAHYPETKARAERLVLEANGASLATCALRPHLIFGPGDPHILPRLIERAKKGRLRIVGDGRNEVSVTYVENAAWAHVCAARTLAPGAPHAGKAYFIAQEEPVRLWPWINDLLARLDVPPVEKRVSEGTARRVGAVLEGAWKVLRLPGEPPMTRFVAAQLCRSHSYSMAPAREDFGYTERVSMDEALRRTVEAFQDA